MLPRDMATFTRSATRVPPGAAVFEFGEQGSMARIVRMLVVVVLLAGGLAVSQRGSAAAIIQPGAPIRIGSNLCTMNWIYDGSGGPYAGTAGHCVSNVGERVYL